MNRLLTIVSVVALAALAGCSGGQVTYESDVARLGDVSAQRAAAIAKASTVTESLFEQNQLSTSDASNVEAVLVSYGNLLDDAYAALLVGDTSLASEKLSLYMAAASAIEEMGLGKWASLMDLVTTDDGTVIAGTRVSPAEIAAYINIALAAWSQISDLIVTLQREGLITNVVALEALSTNLAAKDRALSKLHAALLTKE